MRSLRRHVKGKHEKVLSSCGQCDYKSVDKCSIRRHIRKVHETEDPRDTSIADLKEVVVKEEFFVFDEEKVKDNMLSSFQC